MVYHHYSLRLITWHVTARLCPDLSLIIFADWKILPLIWKLVSSMNSVTDGHALRRSQQTEFISAVLRWHLWFDRAAFERLAPQTQCSRAPPHTRRRKPRSHVCRFTAQMELDVSVRVFLDRQGVCAYHHHHHHITMAAGGSQMTGGQTVIRPGLLTLSWEPERLKILSQLPWRVLQIWLIFHQPFMPVSYPAKILFLLSIFDLFYKFLSKHLKCKYISYPNIWIS